MKKYFGIVKNGYLRLCIAITVAIASWILFFFNAEFSEEFTGWVSIEFNGEIKDENFKDNLLASLQEKGFPKLQVNVDQEEETVKLKINWSLDSDEKVNELSLAIPAYLIDNEIITSADDIVSQAVIGPSVWDYMRSTAVKALIFWLIAMMIYMIFSFWGIRKYVAPGILASVVLLSSILSISLPAGAYWLWMWLDSTIQIDTVFIIAILTIIWYWINDVIIIFDRARENIMKHSKKEFSYKDVFEDSIWQTFRRSIGTSLSTMLVLCSMFIFGTGVVQRFAFTVWVWVIASFFSSLFVAIPTAYILLKLMNKKIK